MRYVGERMFGENVLERTGSSCVKRFLRGRGTFRGSTESVITRTGVVLSIRRVDIPMLL